MAENDLIIDKRFGLGSATNNPLDEYKPESTTYENLAIGFENGLKETTIGLLRDLKLKSDAKQGINLIAQEDWNEDNPYYVEDVDWYDELSYDVAKNIRDYRAHQNEMSNLASRAKGGYSIAQYVGGFAGAMVDPVNLIPFGFGLGGSLLAKSAKIGAYNALLETATFAPLSEYTEEIRGRDVGINDHLLNAGFAFGAGATFNVLGTTGMAVLRSLKHSATGNKKKQEFILDNDKKLPDNNIGPLNSSIDVNAAAARGTASKITGGKASTAANYIKNYNLNESGKIYVDEKGLVHNEGGAGRTEIELVDGQLQISGDVKNIAKLLPALKEIVPEVDSIKIDSPSIKETISNENIDTRINELLETNPTSKIGTDAIDRFRIKIQDDQFDLEIDSTTGEIVAGYIVKRRKNGELRRSKKLTNDELETVKQRFEEDNANFVERTNQQSRKVDETADVVVEDARSGKQKVNNNGRTITRVLRETDGDEDLAVDTIRGKTFEKAIEDGDIVDAVLSIPGFSERTIREAGFRIVRTDGKRDLVEITDFNANNLEPEETSMRNLIFKIIEKRRVRKVTAEGKKTKDACMLLNGSGA